MYCLEIALHCFRIRQLNISSFSKALVKEIDLKKNYICFLSLMLDCVDFLLGIEIW